MTQLANQFAQSAQQGMLDLTFNPNTLSCKISENETATLVPGSPVKLEDSAGGVPKVLLCTADTDNVFGFVSYNLKKSSFVAGDSVEISFYGNVMYMLSGAAIARGALVEADVSASTVITSAGVNPVCGMALDKATGASQLIRVFIIPTTSLLSTSIALLSIVGALGVGGNATVGGTLGVTGAATFAAALSVTGLASVVNLTASGIIKKSVSNYSSGAGALPITKDVIALTTGGAEALTLADGAEGQELEIIMVVDGGAGTLTPAHFANGTTITFDDVGDSVKLCFVNSKWHTVGTPTATVA